MALNPYFLNGTRSEQGLVQDLVNELIRMGGQDVVYLPRKIITEKQIIKEILVSKFDYGFSIEAYVLTYDGFGGQGDILSKFGVRTTNEITFVISKERYDQSIIPFIRNNADVKLTTRPQEGDLIYFPLDNGLFEVKYVETKTPFYQLNNLYSYQLKCEIFEYEDELIDTGIQEVDNSVRNFGYIQTLRLVTNNTINAELSVGLSTNTNLKSVQYIDILNGGYGFESTPTVKIDNPPPGGLTATAIAILKPSNCKNTIDKILITNPGYGYTIPPKVKVVSNSGKGFIGNSIINNGVLGPITIVNPGSDYSSPPSISFSSPSYGTTAQAVSYISSIGEVTTVGYINAGYGYTATPSIVVGQSTGIATGTYKFNEVVSGSTSNTRAYVKDWNIMSGVLKVSIIDGDFIPGEVIVGAGASYKLYSVGTDDIYDPYASNEEIETEADTIIDFSEKNPFGDF